MLETRGVTKAFGGVHAVDALSISVQAASVTALVGPNGSGKTTLINVLTGMLPIDGGSVFVDGSGSFSHIKPYRVASFGITRTFQDVRLFEQMPVVDNILVVLTTRSVLGSFRSRPARRHFETAESLLREVGLWEKRDQLASSLSYGQRKLLEIARALAMDAQIYFFDEPFAGLYPEMIKVITGIVASLRERGKTVVLVEHDMGVIRQLADHVIVMDEGKLLAEGAPDDVLSRREVVEAYLGA